MLWIVTFRGKVLDAAMVEVVTRAGATGIDDGPPVPLEPNEISIVVEGPEDLNRRLKGEPGVTGVYPSSEMSLY